MRINVFAPTLIQPVQTNYNIRAVEEKNQFNFESTSHSRELSPESQSILRLNKVSAL